MAKDKGGAESIDDPSLVEEEEGEEQDAANEGEQDANADKEKDAEANDNALLAEGDPEGEVEVSLEEETEREVRAKEDRAAEEAGALEREGDEPAQDTTEHGKKVKARIDRERRIARDANARAEAERRARIGAEQKALEREKEALETTKAAIELQVSVVKEKLIKAKDDGKTKDEVELQSQLNGLQGRLERVGQAEAGLKEQEEKLKRGAQEDARNPLADEWMRGNAWFGNERFAEQTALVQVIDRAMAKAGWEKTSPKYFEELDRRIRRRIPEVVKYSTTQPKDGDVKRDKNGDKRPTGQKPREPTGGVRRDGGGGGSETRLKGKVTLNQTDFATMRNFGLNPNDPSHRLEFARNKIRGS